MADLPIDIITDLFLRLPATTLVRFRVLSKLHLSLIDSPNFVTSHLNHTLQTNSHLMILLRGPRILRTVQLNSPDNKLTNIEHPLTSTGFTQVFGSCNGLIGLVNSPTDIALFNPSTRKIHRLPAEYINLHECDITLDYVFYGLGYDSVSDDYKVVRMVQSKGGKNDLLHAGDYDFKVFSLKTNSWRKIENLPLEKYILFRFYYHLTYRGGYGVVASNSLHWILPRRHQFIAFNTVLRFDLATEEFGVINFPSELYTENIDIGVLDGCLCLMSIDEFSHVDIWIMLEYEGPWSKLTRVAKPEIIESIEFVRPLVYSKDKSEILFEINNAKNLVWFDLKSKKSRVLKIKDCDNPYSAELVVSSLVLGYKGDPNDVTRRKEERKRTKRDFLSKGFKLKL